MAEIRVVQVNVLDSSGWRIQQSHLQANAQHRALIPSHVQLLLEL